MRSGACARAATCATVVANPAPWIDGEVMRILDREAAEAPAAKFGLTYWRLCVVTVQQKWTNISYA